MLMKQSFLLGGVAAHFQLGFFPLLFLHYPLLLYLLYSLLPVTAWDLYSLFLSIIHYKSPHKAFKVSNLLLVLHGNVFLA